MKYAEVVVNSPISQRRTFSYAIPPHLTVEAGQAVWVPFGEKTLQGIVLELVPSPAVEETRDIASIIEPYPLLSPARIALARWLSAYYLSPLFDAVALLLPPGFERRALTFVSAAGDPEAAVLAALPPDQRQVRELLTQEGKLSLLELERKLGKKRAQTAVSRLVGQGLAVRTYEIEPARVRPKMVPHLSLNVSAAKAEEEHTALRRKGAHRQAEILRFLTERSGPAPWPEIRAATGCERTSVNPLLKRGLVTWQTVAVKREPIDYRRFTPSLPPLLTPAQEAACQRICAALREPGPRPAVFLLHGVTGSGKTEIYLRALGEAVKRGKRGIVLVPEISLTPQTIERFASRFPRRVAVIHSQLPAGEQYDEWHSIRAGDYDVVIGPRSALFSPQPGPGLIVIDEEHEWTYKEQDRAPRYHTRLAALKLAELTGAVVVLGSATPDVESYYHACRGDYQLLELPERVVPADEARLPQVQVVDMREELKAGNRSMFSRDLSRAIAATVNAGEQAILFLNRRGGATFIQCRACGFVLRCRRCAVPLIHHPTGDILVCHQCNYRTPLPARCPGCGSTRMKFLGTGTQKLEQEMGLALPGARLLRWDSDMTRQREAHEDILDRFRSGQADILIGTQMVAKGLDLPSVTLVGVVSADTSLNLPDFRVGERTFQLLSQVSGRAGRGPLGGRVIIQTFSPAHYAVQAAAGHDYAAFYRREIEYRRQLGNPPFSQLARLTFSHTNDAVCRREAEKMYRRLTEERDARGVSGLGFIGPAPAFIHRLRGRYRWQLILRGTELPAFLSSVSFPHGWVVDIDPVSLL